MSRMRAILLTGAAALTLSMFCLAGAALAVGGTAPGGPGDNAIWTPANKAGFGTSTATTSKVWHTLGDGKLTEVYYPDLGTPSVRDLQFIVSDGKTFADRESDATTQSTQLADARSLTYRQVNTKSGRWRITKTYVTDPSRNTLLIDVDFQSLTGKPLDLFALYDPSLANNGMDDSGTSAGATLLAADGTVASALAAKPAFTKVSNGYLGASDGWQDLRSDYRWTGPTTRRRTATSCSSAGQRSTACTATAT
jgi:glucoamylase